MLGRAESQSRSWSLRGEGDGAQMARREMRARGEAWMTMEGPQIARASLGMAAMRSHLPRVENGVSPTLRPQEVSDGAAPTSSSLGGATGAPPGL